MKNIFLILLSLWSVSAYSQYTSNGKIDYVRTSNIAMSIKLEMEEEMKDNPWFQEMMKKMPKNATKFYTMTFDEDKSYYGYVKDGPEEVPKFGGKDPASENIVIKDFQKDSITTQKEFFGSDFLISDSLPQFQWKIEDEIRQIAGYNCRKATTIVMDSVVVVAFYTDEIMVSSGPESFGGLPGMILGLAIPRLYTTWFATKVEFVPYDASIIKPFDKKAKKMDNKELMNTLGERVKEWGPRGAQLLYKVGI